MPSKETDYLDAIRNNDVAGLRNIYREFLPRITNLIRQNGGSLDDAQDVFQDALIVIYKKCQSADFKLSSKFYTLLYGICRNLWGNQLQKKSRSELRIIDDYQYESIPDLSAAIGETEEQRLFWDAFQQLGPDCQQILKLFFAKVKMEAITKKLSLSSVGYAKKKKFQCKERLVKLVRADRRFAELQIN